MNMPIVFISYSRKDRYFADLAQKQLEERGLKVWLDRGALKAGEDWSAAMNKGITSSHVLLLVLSPNSQNSTYVTYEWAYALGQGKKVVPVLLKETDEGLHISLRNLQHLPFEDYRDGDWDSLAEELKRPDERADDLDKYDRAKTDILEYLERKKFQRVSYVAIREWIDPDYTDEFLMDLIRRNRSIFRKAVLKNGPGIARND
jgi:hypothetical protein